ncbi:ribonuclease HII, partial [Microstroma glucosiphilum]
SQSQSQSQSQSDSQSQVDAVLVASTPPVPSVHGSPLVDSYTYQSPVPSQARGVPCILGVDEAGRGPVLGPLVYGVAYCPASFSDELKGVGFADSKALTAERRDALLAALINHPDQLGWATQTMSPQDISAGMLRKRPFNLNQQSTEATVHLIHSILSSGVDISEIFVDTVGDPATYCKTLKSFFPQAKYKHIEWTVTSKADAIYPIVGAASIAAKVTRDRWVEDWRYAESVGDQSTAGETQAGPSTSALEETAPASPTKGSKKRKKPDAPIITSDTPHAFWHEFGSGYPGDPGTVAYLQRTIDPVFGWPGVVRFSWATIKTLLEEKRTVKGAASSAGATRASKAVNGGAGPATIGDAANTVAPFLTSTGSLPPPVGQPRGYKIKWIDEPAQITSFFAAKGGTPSNGSSAGSGDPVAL